VRFVKRVSTVPHYEYANGQYARNVHPVNIDARQGYVLAGCTGVEPIQDISEFDLTDNSFFRFIMRPWCGSVVVDAWACCMDLGGAVTLEVGVYSDETVPILLTTKYVFDNKNTSPVQAFPMSYEQWASIQWISTGGSVAETPSDTSGALSIITPVNAYQKAFVKLTASAYDGSLEWRIRSIRIHQYASQTQVVNV